MILIPSDTYDPRGALLRTVSCKIQASAGQVQQSLCWLPALQTVLLACNVLPRLRWWTPSARPLYYHGNTQASLEGQSLFVVTQSPFEVCPPAVVREPLRDKGGP